MKVLKIANGARTTGEPNSPSIEKCANIYATGSGKGKWNDVQCKWDKSWITHAPVIQVFRLFTSPSFQYCRPVTEIVKPLTNLGKSTRVILVLHL